MVPRAPPPPAALDSEALTAALRAHLLGGAPVVLWEERGDRALVHVARLTARVEAAGLSIALPLETAETGATPLTLALALAGEGEAPSAVAATTEEVDGPPALAGRWGNAVQEAVFAALLALLAARASAAGEEARGFQVKAGTLSLVTARKGARR